MSTEPRRLGYYIDYGSDLFRVLIGDRPFPPDATFALNRARELALDVALAMTFAIQIGFNAARTLARDLGLSELAKELDALSIPTNKSATAQRQEFTGKLRTLMIKHREIGYDWGLTERQEARLADYLNATDLLRDCLELAFMPPDEKKAIQNSFYLPPTQVGERQNA